MSLFPEDITRDEAALILMRGYIKEENKKWHESANTLGSKSSHENLQVAKVYEMQRRYPLGLVAESTGKRSSREQQLRGEHLDVLNTLSRIFYNPPFW